MALDSKTHRMILFTVGVILIGGTALFYYFYSGGKDTSSSKLQKKNDQENQPSENMLDIQFSEANRPLVVYKDMFTKSAPWIGGYDIGIGKTIISQTQKAK